MNANLNLVNMQCKCILTACMHQHPCCTQVHTLRVMQQTPSQEPSATTSIATNILFTKGAFCTPRSVVRGITTRQKPMATEVVEGMKSLSEDGIGHYTLNLQKKRKFITNLCRLKTMRQKLGNMLTMFNTRRGFQWLPMPNYFQQLSIGGY